MLNHDVTREKVIAAIHDYYLVFFSRFVFCMCEAMEQV